MTDSSGLSVFVMLRLKPVDTPELSLPVSFWANFAPLHGSGVCGKLGIQSQSNGVKKLLLGAPLPTRFTTDFHVPATLHPIQTRR
jgi:hypothetical protein